MLTYIRKMLKNDKGFTLIELMVVVVILGILAAAAVPKFVNKKQDAIDSRVEADLQVLQNAVEMYYFDNGSYPTDDNFDALVSDGYLKKLPKDPVAESGTNKVYKITSGLVEYK